MKASSSELGKIQNISGTPGYIAPEIFKLQFGSYNSDVFALGVVAFQLIFRPLQSEELNEVHRRSVKNENIADYLKGLIQEPTDPVRKDVLEAICQMVHLDHEQRPGLEQTLEYFQALSKLTLLMSLKAKQRAGHKVDAFGKGQNVLGLELGVAKFQFKGASLGLFAQPMPDHLPTHPNVNGTVPPTRALSLK